MTKKTLRSLPVRLLLLVQLTLLWLDRSDAFFQKLFSNPKTSTSAKSMSKPPSYDLVVVGAGVVGATAALTASSSGPSGGARKRRVALIDAPMASGQLMVNGEDLSLGAPTGLFSKALRDTSKRIKVGTLRGMGLREDSVWNEVISSCVSLASSNAQDMLRQLEMAGVDYIQGFCSFPDSGGTDTLIMTKEDGSTQTISCGKILIATGSKPFLPGGIPFDGKRIFDSDTINTISYLPKSIAITGSGIIAVEFAKIFRNLGADVTLIIRDQIPRNALMKIGLDKDVAATLVSDLVRSGIKIERGAQVKEFDVPPFSSTGLRQPIKLTLEATGGGHRATGSITEVKCDAYLAAVGRKPNTNALNLGSAGIQMDAYGGVLVDSSLCTTAPAGNVFAAGDVVGRPFLASTGVAQAKAAINAMFAEDGKPPVLTVKQCEEGDDACTVDGVSQAGTLFDPASLASNPFAFPTGVWSSPEAAYYGFTTEQAKDRGFDAGEGIALYAECLRGRVFNPNGLLKLVFDKKTGRIVGGTQIRIHRVKIDQNVFQYGRLTLSPFFLTAVHICGEDACELIHYGMELVKGQRTILELSQAMFSAVTFHEMYRIAAQAGLDEAGARKRRAGAGKALAKRNRELASKE
jgi:NAD(P) transhydrogenase